ncbi:hypothetical protein [Streptomyces sp. NBC_01353]|uniref:hypothetical protein n=1 Tax=Streptomyces sp. NBC_01353 TaxID=2903835 RepID=UPI002E33A363|nr:hypothetical protein [Streptomyces sp. NBC_01353]
MSKIFSTATARPTLIADRAFEQCPIALGVYAPELRFWGFDMSAEYWARQRLLVLN